MISVPEPFGLYLVLTDPVVGYEKCAEAAVIEGVRFIQLRMKNAPRERVLEMAHRLRALTRNAATRFIVNDDVTIAREVDADGVHLGQTDTPIADARHAWPVPGKLFGWSTHNEAQVEAARDLRPHYIGFGPIFPTPTKADADPVVGCERLAAVAAQTELPIVAIGGIDEFNLSLVLATGVRNFAVVRAVCAQADPRAAIRRLVDIWKAYGAERRPILRFQI